MTRLVGLDTMTVIWAMRQAGPRVKERDQSKQKQAIELIRWLEKEQAEIIVPAVAIAEVLIPLNTEQRATLPAGPCETFPACPV